MKRVFSCALVAIIVANSMNILIASALNEDSDTSQFIESTINQESNYVDKSEQDSLQEGLIDEIEPNIPQKEVEENQERVEENNKIIEVHNDDRKYELIEELVSQFYVGFNGREADDDGLNYWASLIYENEITVADVILQFINSDEFRSKNYSNEDYVQVLYRSLFNRDADTDGLNYWVSVLKGGNSKNFVLASNFNSSEFQSILDNIGINNKGNIKLDLIDRKGDLKSIINDLYRGFYNREGDEAGLNYWADEILYNRNTVAQVVEYFINNDEFKSKNYSDKEYINVLYKALFGREADESGLNYWVEQLHLGEHRQFILYNLFNSDECKTRMTNIGIKNIGQVKMPTVNDKVKLLVDQLYKGLYGRSGDELGIDYWSNLITSGEKTISEVVEIFVNSSEMKDKNYSDKQFVQAIYRALLRREANSKELNYWVDMIKIGNSRKFVLASNFNSEECQSILNRIGLSNKGNIKLDLIDRKGEVKDIINTLYKGLFNREGDESGLNYWSEEIIYNRNTVAQVVEGLINSNEFKSKNYSGEEYVKVLYKALLGREADTSGLNYWLSQLINGKSERYVLAAMFNSNEFKDKLQYVGIKNIGEIRLSTNDTKETVAKARVRVSAINLREQPSQNSKILTQLKSGNLVTVLGRIKGDLTYYKVQYVNNGKIYTGYVSITLSSGNSLEIFEDNVNNEFLGVLSEKYESNGDPGRVSDTPGDYGGKSYGAWQFSSKMGSLDSFVNWLKGRNTSFYNKLMDARKLDGNTNCGENFDKAWKEIARDHYNTFYTLQQTYVKENNYDKLVNRLLKVGNFSNVLSSFSARNVIWSTVVQHGVSGAYNIIAPLKNITDVEEFITAVYAERGRTDANGILVYFKSSSIAVQQSVAKRFVNEKNEAIKLYRYSIN